MTILEKVKQVQNDIQEISRSYGRSASEICLLAVSKGQTAAAIQEAFAAGLHHFGENYWQEAQSKLQELQRLPLIWHFIGPLQSNKAADIARHFDWVHSVSREKIAGLLSEHRGNIKTPLNVCIQVNLDGESSKAGVEPADVPALAKLITTLPNLKLRGLMAIPKPTVGAVNQYQSLQRFTRGC